MEYTKIYEVQSSQNLTIIQLAFQKNEINHKTHFENSLLLGNSYALGNSGAIIEVIKEQKREAEKILENLGFEVFYDEEMIRFEFIKKIEKFTKNIPFISKFESSQRILMTLFLLVLVLFSILVSLFL